MSMATNLTGSAAQVLEDMEFWNSTSTPSPWIPEMDNFTTFLNTTASHEAGSGIPKMWGYVACMVGIVLFGSNWVPVKKFETGDGVFFQWVSCTGIWLVGLVVQCTRTRHGEDTFYPQAMLGGIIWTTGNMMTVPIIKTIGIGQGILIWASVSILIGWVTSRFGLFHLKAEVPSHPALNYIGLTLCLASLIFYMSIKTTAQTRVTENNTVNIDVQEPLTVNETAPVTEERKDECENDDQTFLDKMSPLQKRIFGMCAATFAGVMYGLQFLPVTLLTQNTSNSQNGLDYVFSHWTGILACSTFYFILYAVVKKNRPTVFPSAILPGLVSGGLWGVAAGGWFVANSTLTQAISYPIISSGPSMVGALWGVFFKEIQGLRNFLLMAAAFSLTIAGSLLTAFSA